MLLDPHAAHMVLHSGLNVVQIPLRVSHTVLLTPEVVATFPRHGFNARLLRGFVEFFSATSGFCLPWLCPKAYG